MTRKVALVTGAGGEMGHLLVPALRSRGYDVVALDLIPLPDEFGEDCRETVQASILDTEKVRDLIVRYRPDLVFHLAAILSSKAEESPEKAHRVNVQGTVGLTGLCLELAATKGRDVRFLFPSSIAVYGLPDAETKRSANAVKETEWNTPSRMYGCNKLYCELLGTYFAQRALRRKEPGLDFRSIRFPGLVSASTVPSGGTSDYAPEMLHAAAKRTPYACFVGPDTRLPFMTMPDAVKAFLDLAEAPADRLSRRVYNIRAFSPSAEEFRARALQSFPNAEITFEPDETRQAIVDSWPADVDDGLARHDWGFEPQHRLEAALEEYLLPALRERYPQAAAMRAGGEPE